MPDENTPLEPPNIDLPPAAPQPVEFSPAPPFEASTAAAPPAGEATSEDKLWALLAYVLAPVVPIIILFLEDKKNRPYLKSHNMQALVAGVAIVVITMILGVIPLVGCIAPIVALALWIAMIYWGYQAYNGKAVTIPVVTDFVKSRGWA